MDQRKRIRIGKAKHEYFYDWNDEYKVWFGTRAMDGASRESTMLVIVPGVHNARGCHIAVNIQKDAVNTSEGFWDAVKQGKQVFLTYDNEFASEGLHIWCTNEVVRDGSPQWVDTDWKVYTSSTKVATELKMVFGCSRLEMTAAPRRVETTGKALRCAGSIEVWRISILVWAQPA